MAKNTQQNSDTSNEPSKPEDNLLYSNWDRSSNDYREIGVVELDIGQLKKILQRIEERAEESDVDSGVDEEIDSIHVVGHICSGWDPSMWAELKEDAPHLNMEEGDRYEFSHFEAIPHQIHRSSEYLARTAPNTIRNSRVAPKLENYNRVTDWDRLQSASEKLSDLRSVTGNVEGIDLESEIRELEEKIYNKMDDVEDQ